VGVSRRSESSDSHTRRDLTKPSRDVLVAVLGRLIPSGSESPGAREARVDEYICRALVTHHQQYRSLYEIALRSLDDRAHEMHAQAYADLPSQQQDALLSELEHSGAHDPPGGTPQFFDLLLQHTREGMFGDPRWGGNHKRVGWRLLGYPGPRFHWSAEDQRVLTRPVRGESEPAGT
jgi:gluconate 2-dehydrogenase gamma chain